MREREKMEGQRGGEGERERGREGERNFLCTSGSIKLVCMRGSIKCGRRCAGVLARANERVDLSSSFHVYV
jgi:hypothetical protein